MRTRSMPLRIIIQYRPSVRRQEGNCPSRVPVIDPCTHPTCVGRPWVVGKIRTRTRDFILDRISRCSDRFGSINCTRGQGRGELLYNSDDDDDRDNNNNNNTDLQQRPPVIAGQREIFLFGPTAILYRYLLYSAGWSLQLQT